MSDKTLGFIQTKRPHHICHEKFVFDKLSRLFTGFSSNLENKVRFYTETCIPKFPDLWACLIIQFIWVVRRFFRRPSRFFQWSFVTFVTWRNLPNYSYGIAGDLRFWRTAHPTSF